MKMKNLLLAAVGFAGFALASSAFAQCANTNLSAWNGGTQALSGGTVNVVAGGLDTSACRLETTSGTAASSLATVTFNDTSDETRFRAQFLFNADSLSSLPAGRAVQIYTANANAPFPAVNPTLQMVRINLIGSGSGKFISVIAACNNGGSNQCSATYGPLAAGTNRIEFDLQVNSTTGYVTVWLNSTTEGSPTAPFGGGAAIANINNAGWNGVRAAKLGLASGNAAFRANNHGEIIKYDSYDSRRQTFIGG